STGTIQDQYGLTSIAVNAGGTVNGSMFGGRFQAENSGGADQIYGQLTHLNGDGTVGQNATAMYGFIDSAYTITGSLYGLRLDFTNSNTVDTAYGIRVETLTDGAVSNYGLFIAGASGGSSTNASIWVDNGWSRFAPATAD